MKQDVSGAKHFREALAATPQEIRQQMEWSFHIADQIDDGSCIQLGIGAIPDAVGLALKTKHDLGIQLILGTAQRNKSDFHSYNSSLMI